MNDIFFLELREEKELESGEMGILRKKVIIGEEFENMWEKKGEKKKTRKEKLAVTCKRVFERKYFEGLKNKRSQ